MGQQRLEPLPHQHTLHKYTGVAAALKVLFSANDCSGEAPSADAPFSDLTLERNEAIALINLLARFSNSLHLYKQIASQLQQQGGGGPAPPLLGGTAVA